MIVKKLKINLIQLIWSLGLRGIADRLQFRYLKKKYERENLIFLEKYPDFALPPPDLIFDANHNLSWNTYRNSGISDAQAIGDIIERHVDGSAISIFEWGCGPGRIIRHLQANLSRFQFVRLFGSDYNSRSVSWCATSLLDIEFVENQLSPPIALPTHQFNFIYAISIFTHLSEKSIADWLGEMHRLLDDQGYFAFTTHGEKYFFCFTPTQIESFKKGNIVIRDGGNEGKKLFGAFHPKEWVESALSLNGFRVVSYVPEGFHRQDLWIVRKMVA